ncbi:hypothetical protein [Paenarthrobacter sp. NPDC089316]|uniref:hypothetical protein n=1 Tax=unclassified Paenarthrobacter TaxID=2634190 RepID=UPI00343E4040
MSQKVEMHREMAWPFSDARFPEGLGAVVMKSVLSGERPVLQVLHNPDNGWGFADGVDDPNTPGGAVAAHISHITRLDPTLAETAKLPPGTLANRLEVGGEWHIRSFTWEEEPTLPDSQDNSLEGANGTAANFENLSPGVRVVHNALELAMEPELWTVDLRDGSQITVLTHGYSVEGNEGVFSLLFKGEPPFELDTLRIPLALMHENYS